MNKVLITALSALILFQFGCAPKKSSVQSPNANAQSVVKSAEQIEPETKQPINVVEPEIPLKPEQKEICPATNQMVVDEVSLEFRRPTKAEKFYIKRFTGSEICPNYIVDRKANPKNQQIIELSFVVNVGYELQSFAHNVAFYACDQRVRNLVAIEDSKFIRISWVHISYDDQAKQEQYQNLGATVSKAKLGPHNLREIICEKPLSSPTNVTPPGL